jgi:hypothetical protein
MLPRKKLAPKKKVTFSMWDLKPFYIYTLYSQEKNYVFSMWAKKLLKIFF